MTHGNKTDYNLQKKKPPFHIIAIKSLSEYGYKTDFCKWNRGTFLKEKGFKVTNVKH